MCRPDCAEAQAGLHICCSHMTKSDQQNKSTPFTTSVYLIPGESTASHEERRYPDPEAETQE